VVTRLEEALGRFLGKLLNGASVLVLGVAYKKDVSDTRESPSLEIMDLIERRGGHCRYHDPHVPIMEVMCDYPRLSGRASIVLTTEALNEVDAVLVCTDHEAVDYALVADAAKLIIDTPNVFARKTLVTA
jgi:UDP-N-acetyl-D-glucosamine dehydrogenase